MVNTSPVPDNVEDPAVLDEFLTEPPIKRIELWFELGDASVSASNFKGVTIKDALKAIHKRYKTKVRPPADKHVHIAPEDMKYVDIHVEGGRIGRRQVSEGLHLGKGTLDSSAGRSLTPEDNRG